MKIVKMPFNRSFMRYGGMSIDLLKQVLDLLPTDTRFVGCGQDSSDLVDYIFFTSDTFLEIKEGEKVPEIVAWFKRCDDKEFVEKIDFGNSYSCAHIWKTYSGIHESYDYCQNCNIRK